MQPGKLTSYDSLPSVSDDDIFYVVNAPGGGSPTSHKVTAAALRASMVYTYDVKGYGAVGDGSTDDTAAIQLAINAAEASPGAVYFPSGTYKIAGTLTMDTGSDVVFTGPGATLQQFTSDTPTLKLSGVSRVKVVDLRFVGLGTETPWAGGSTAQNNVAGIWISACTDCEIRHCHLSNHAGGGIIFEGVSDGLKIIGNTVVGMGSGVISYDDNGADGAIKTRANSYAQSAIIIADNDISGHCFGLLPAGTVDMVITGNFIHDIPGQHGAYITQSGDLIFANNVVLDCAEVGAKVQHSLHSEIEPIISLHGNVIGRCGTVGLGVNWAGTGDAHFTRNVSVSGNNVFDCGYTGLYLWGVADAHISGNRIRKCDIYGLQMTECDGSVVDNRISECEKAAVAIYKPTNNIILDGLTIVDAPINATMSGDAIYRTVIYLNDVASPDNKYIYLGNISAKFDQYTAQTDPSYSLQYFISTSANVQAYQTGPLINELDVPNSFAGTFVRLSECGHYVPPSGADDTTMLQAALTAADDGSTIVLNGSYSISSALNVATSGTSIVGLAGTKITQTGTNKTDLTITSKDRVSVSGIHFIGLGTETPWADGGTTTNSVGAIHVTTSTNVHIHDCQMTNHAGGSIVLEGACENVRIVGNRIVGMGSPTISAHGHGMDGGIKGAASSIAQTGIVIANNDISGHCFGITSLGVVDQSITGNFIHDIPGQNGITLTGVGDQIISGNVIADCEEYGIKIVHSLAENVESAVNISGNTIVRCGYSGILSSVSGSGVGYYLRNVLLAANDIYDVKIGMYLRGLAACQVSGNRIRKTTAQGFLINDFDGTLCDNRVEECDYCGMSIYAPQDRVVVDGLTIIDCPINAGVETGTDHQNAILLTDETSPNGGTVYLGNIHVSFQRQTPPANLTYCIYASADTSVVVTGRIVNKLSKGHNWLGTVAGLSYSGLQNAPTAVADGDTAITAANLQTRILTMHPSTARAPTVPTGTAINGIINIGEAIDWSLINIAEDASTITVSVAADHTLVGKMTVAQNETGSFRTRCSAANTAVTYRLA